MNKKHIFLFFLFCLIFNQNCFSQEVPDSTNVYQNIQDFSKKNNISRFIYKILFRSAALNKKKDIVKPKPIETSKTRHLEGRIIRNIYINTLDPFGYSVSDTTKRPKDKTSDFGNLLHIKTKEITITNLLLFKKNDPLDFLVIKESERLIRGQRYIRQVSIEPQETENSKDSVDIVIRALDTWSLIPNGSLSSNQGNLKITERNLLGFGHQIAGNYKNRFSDKETALSGLYSITNIKNSFIKFDLNYENDFDNNSKRSASLSRNFYSPLTKWGGGLYFENRLKNELFHLPDTIIENQIKYELQEYWIGKSFKIFSGDKYEKRTTKLIISTLINKKHFLRRPDNFLDPSSFFSNERNFISQFGVSSQKYYKDSYIFNYDIVEDIPYGEVYAITLGLQNKNNKEFLYFGSKIAYGEHFVFGYLNSTLEWGSFFNNSNALQTAFRVDFNYISPLFEYGKWRIRQFIKPSYIWGNNRDLSEKDRLSLNENFGIQGFNSPIIGTQKWQLTLQTQTYSPGNWYGFHFSPYFNMAMGALANNNRNLFQSKVYSKISIGVLINNDYLVFNSFQISFSYYPIIPFEGDNIMKTNSFENTDLILSDFQLTKPSYIQYQ